MQLKTFIDSKPLDVIGYVREVLERFPLSFDVQKIYDSSCFSKLLNRVN